jgi:hypothetical protein
MTYLVDEGKPRDECAVALTVKQKRPIKGTEAIAERPDGTRVSLLPYPRRFSIPPGISSAP